MVLSAGLYYPVRVLSI